MTRDLEIILAPLREEFRNKVLCHDVELMAEILQDAIRSGEVRMIDPQKAAFVLWTAAEALFTQKQYRYEELLPSFIAIARDGLRNHERLGGNGPRRGSLRK